MAFHQNMTVFILYPRYKVYKSDGIKNSTLEKREKR